MWESVASDAILIILWPFLLNSGNKYLMVVIDYFSKWEEIDPISNQEVITVAEALLKK